MRSRPTKLQDSDAITEDDDPWLDDETASACKLAQPFPSQVMQIL